MNDGEVFIPIIAIICTFGIPGFVVWKYIEARNAERMAIIDKGMNADDIRELFHQERRERRNPNPLTNLKWGLLVFFIGIGLVIGKNLSSFEYHDGGSYNTFDMIPAFVLISGGLSLLIFYFIASKKEKTDKIQQQNASQSQPR